MGPETNKQNFFKGSVLIKKSKIIELSLTV